MHLLNLILNLAGLGLWLGWRPAGLEALGAPPEARPRGRRFRAFRWVFLAGLGVLVVGRSWLYWKVGHDLGWIARLDLGIVTLDFNSAVPGRMFLFSVASFALFLGGWFLWLTLLGAVNRGTREANPWLRVVTGQLGWLSRVPAGVSLLWPALALGGAWAASQPTFQELGLVAAVRPGSHLAQQAGLVGLGAYLGWRWLVVGVLVIHVANTYLYLGSPPWLTWLSLTARQLLRPLAMLPLHVGRVDLAPAAGIALAWLGFPLIRAVLVRLLERLPL
jgi:hypothetical protein